MNPLLILLGKTILWLSQTINLGSGSTWPGHIAMEANPNFLKQVLKKNPDLKIVIIAGTNGKTTTSLMLQKILEENGLKVFRNEAGANLLNGIASTIIANANLTGRLSYDAAIFEIDENNLGPILSELSAPIKSGSHVNFHMSIVLLNLFRDQLDRYGEVNTIAKKWQDALENMSLRTESDSGSNLTLFTNGDDPMLTYITQNAPLRQDYAGQAKLKTYYFGLDEKLMTTKDLRLKTEDVRTDLDFTYCPKCQTKLKYLKVAYSHLGKFVCPNCKYANPDSETFSALPHPLFGTYNIYNINAAAIVAQNAFDVPEKNIEMALKDFKPAFGRQEAINYKGKKVIVLLSKNPAGFNQSIEAIASIVARSEPTKQPHNVLLVLNDRIPDGRDVSWIWDVDFENLPKEAKIFISGDRAYDMGLRIKYSQNNQEPLLGFTTGQANSNLQTNVQIFKNLNDAIETSIKETEKDETLFILPTYSAMLETRKILLGRKLL